MLAPRAAKTEQSRLIHGRAPKRESTNLHHEQRQQARAFRAHHITAARDDQRRKTNMPSPRASRSVLGSACNNAGEFSVLLSDPSVRNALLTCTVTMIKPRHNTDNKLLLPFATSLLKPLKCSQNT